LTKHTLIIALVGLNLFFLAAILFSVSSPTQAHAQPVGGAGNYLVVAAEVQNNYDALYVVDLPQRLLHVFALNRARPAALEYQDSRDLAQDFRAR
jgi:hypothetical protein